MDSPSDLVPIAWASHNAIPDLFLIRLKDTADMASHISWMREQVDKHDEKLSKYEVVHEYKIIKGYTAKLTGAVLEVLRRRDDVKSIAQDRRPDSDMGPQCPRVLSGQEQ